MLLGLPCEDEDEQVKNFMSACDSDIAIIVSAIASSMAHYLPAFLYNGLP